MNGDHRFIFQVSMRYQQIQSANGVALDQWECQSDVAQNWTCSAV